MEALHPHPVDLVEPARVDRAVDREALEAAQPDVLITDPPRAGMHEDVVKRILEMAPQRIVYVSCNAATQARDLKILANQYRVVAIQPVDMFPHTYHVENVVRLNRLYPKSLVKAPTRAPAARKRPRACCPWY